MESKIISQNDKQVFRELVKQYAEVACLDVHANTVSAWKRLNSLRPERPMIMIDQIPWQELNGSGELTTLCEDPFLKSLEIRMRQNLYKWRHFPCDMVLKPILQVPKAVRNTGFGVQTKHRSDNLNHTSASTHTYEDMIPDDEALLKLHPAEVAEDKAETERRRDLVLELAGDILPVRLSGVSIWAAVWDRIVLWRGADTVLYDLADRPDFIHRLMTRLLELEMDQLDQYEALGLLDAEMETIHCAGTFCEELPGADYDPENHLARNCWVAGAAQIFSEVSPAMHDEFEIEYMKPYYERFGLVNYGCCEPLHRKIDIIRKIPNVRSISISPWADVEMAAEKIGGDYVMARKPNPAFVAMDTFDPQLIAEETKATLEACQRNGTPCEFILKDITTVRNKPERLTWWYETVKKTVLNYRA